MFKKKHDFNSVENKDFGDVGLHPSRDIREMT